MSNFGIFCIGSAVNTSLHVEEEDAADLPDCQIANPFCLITSLPTQIARLLEQKPRWREQILSMGLPGVAEVSYLKNSLDKGKPKY